MPDISSATLVPIPFLEIPDRRTSSFTRHRICGDKLVNCWVDEQDGVCTFVAHTSSFSGTDLSSNSVPNYRAFSSITPIISNCHPSILRFQKLTSFCPLSGRFIVANKSGLTIVIWDLFWICVRRRGIEGLCSKWYQRSWSTESEYYWFQINIMPNILSSSSPFRISHGPAIIWLIYLPPNLRWSAGQLLDPWIGRCMHYCSVYIITFTNRSIWRSNAQPIFYLYRADVWYAIDTIYQNTFPLNGRPGGHFSWS